MAVCYILRRKTTRRSPVLMAELRKLWAFAEQHEIALRTVSWSVCFGILLRRISCCRVGRHG